jgi:hypothetical protein
MVLRHFLATLGACVLVFTVAVRGLVSNLATRELKPNIQFINNNVLSCILRLE